MYDTKRNPKINDNVQIGQGNCRSHKIYRYTRSSRTNYKFSYFLLAYSTTSEMYFIYSDISEKIEFFKGISFFNIITISDVRYVLESELFRHPVSVRKQKQIKEKPKASINTRLADSPMNGDVNGPLLTKRML